jgi:hypothetical protein
MKTKKEARDYIPGGRLSGGGTANALMALHALLLVKSS